jgi:hypothetical protein
VNFLDIATRKTVIGCGDKPLLVHISIVVQNLESLLISDQHISSGSRLEPLLIISKLEAV